VDQEGTSVVRTQEATAGPLRRGAGGAALARQAGEGPFTPGRAVRRYGGPSGR